MALTETEWNDAIFYFTFMAQKKSFYLPALQEADKVPLPRKKELINDYCETVLGFEGAEIEKNLRDRFAVEGISIRGALNIITTWKQFLLSKLTSQNLLKARCFQAADKSALEAALTAWRDKATNLKLNLVPNFEDNTAAGGVEMFISYKDIQYGSIPTLFALGHEFGHQTDFSIRDKNPEVLKCLYANWAEGDHSSWEYYADSFSIVFLALNSGDRDKLVTGIDGYLGDTPDDGVHPDGRLRMNQIRKALGTV